MRSLESEVAHGEAAVMFGHAIFGGVDWAHFIMSHSETIELAVFLTLRLSGRELEARCALYFKKELLKGYRTGNCNPS